MRNSPDPECCWCYPALFKKGPYPANLLRVWLAVRALDPQSHGGVYVKLSELGELLGVRESTACKYLQQSRARGLLRVAHPAKGRPGVWYVRYTSYQTVLKAYHDPFGRCRVQIPLRWLREGSLRRLAARVLTLMGQHFSREAERRRPHRGKKPVLAISHRQVPQVDSHFLRVIRQAQVNPSRDEAEGYLRPGVQAVVQYAPAGTVLFRGENGPKTAPLLQLQFQCRHLACAGDTAGPVLGWLWDRQGNNQLWIDGDKARIYGVSQATVAHRLGISPSTVSRHLKGIRRVRLKEKVSHPGDAWNALKPYINPDYPWLTVVPFHPRSPLPPGVYCLENARTRTAPYLGGYVLNRLGTNLYFEPDFRLCVFYTPQKSLRRHLAWKPQQQRRLRQLAKLYS